MDNTPSTLETELKQGGSPQGTKADTPANETKSPQIGIAPQDSKRSVFDVDFSKLGGLEQITKAITIAAIVSYAAGFLIVVINEGNLGFLDTSLLKPRAMIVGIVALLLVVLPISFTRGVVIRPRSDEKESADQTLSRMGLSVINFLASCGAVWFVAALVFVRSAAESVITVHDGTVVRHKLQATGWMLSVLLIGINGVLANPSDRRAYWKAPRFWMGYSVLWFGLMAFAAWTLWRTGSAVYFVWSLLTSIVFHGFARDWQRGYIRSFSLPAALFWSLSLLSLYATFLFPRIKVNWGGGNPIPALLTISR